MSMSSNTHTHNHHTHLLTYSQSNTIITLTYSLTHSVKQTQTHKQMLIIYSKLFVLFYSKRIEVTLLCYVTTTNDATIQLTLLNRACSLLLFLNVLLTLINLTTTVKIPLTHAVVEHMNNCNNFMVTIKQPSIMMIGTVTNLTLLPSKIQRITFQPLHKTINNKQYSHFKERE